eukprot:gene20910-19889_t
MLLWTALSFSLVLLQPATGMPSSPEQPWKCTSDASCQLNGVCNKGSGRCDCEPQWTGTNCSALNLGQSFRAYTGREDKTTTWGGHPVQDDDGTWHMYVAEMTHHCTLSAWTTNSETVHATSKHVEGPYSFQNVVQVPWSHNPLVTRDPATGDYLVLRSPNASGPFVDVTVAWPLNSTSEWPGIQRQFSTSKQPRPDVKTWAALFQDWFVNGSGAGGRFLPTPGGRGYAEDSVLFRDKNGFPHMIISSPAYTFDVVLDGEAITLRQRERPQVVVNSQTLALEYLFNGVTISGEPHSLNM